MQKSKENPTKLMKTQKDLQKFKYSIFFWEPVAGRTLYFVLPLINVKYDSCIYSVFTAFFQADANVVVSD